MSSWTPTTVPITGADASYNIHYLSFDGSDSGNGSSTSPWASFSTAYSVMQSGDTLIVRDGSYSLQTLMGRNPGFNSPISGTSSRYTAVQAETPGGVIMQDAGVTMNGAPTSTTNYIWIDGFVFLNQTIGSGPNSVDHMKITRCGFADAADGNDAVFSVFSSSYVLVEDCYAWGSGRYKFLSYLSDHIVLRRCVARFDRANTPEGDPMAALSVYTSTYVEVQNCIAIDGDQPSQWINPSEYSGCFYVPSTAGPATNINFTGCIGLNFGMQFGGITPNTLDVVYSNCVGWHIREGAWIRSNPAYDHCTFGDLYGPALGTTTIGLQWVAANFDNSTSITNSVLYNVAGTALDAIAFEDYNVFWGNTVDRGDGTSTGAHSQSENPELSYILRIDTSSTALKGQASDGGDIGANIICKVGVDHTLWGDAGYNLLTSNSLWPWPYESTIGSFMQAYSYSNEIGTITGNRGFAASGQTLTNYIWTYAGGSNPYSGPPPTIYQRRSGVHRGSRSM